MTAKENKISIDKSAIALVTTTDDIPQGTKNLYLSTTGGATDNLASMPNYNLLSNQLNNHLANTNNPHALMLSGVRTHQTQITLTGNLTLNNTNYIDCLLVSNTINSTITIPNETMVGYTFATNAAFTAFRMTNATLTVQAATGVSFTNFVGSTVVLPNPQSSYYIFIRQSLNQWAVVALNSASSSVATLQSAYTNGDGSITLAAAKPFLIKNSSATQTFNVADTGATIGNGSKSTSSIFDVFSTTQGSRPYPSLTTTQRNAIASPSIGLTVYNVSTNSIDFYNGSAWISLSQNSFTWREVTVNTAMVANNGYIAGGGGVITFTLPVTAEQGSIIRISGKSGGWRIIPQNASQTIRFGNTTTTSGGSLSSSNQWDCIEILCVTTSTVFVVQSSVGNFALI